VNPHTPLATSKIKHIRIALMLVIMASVEACGPHGSSSQHVYTEQVRRLIDSEAPVGSTESQVEAFLHRHNFQYSNQMEKDHSIFAVAHDPSNAHLVTTSLQIAFHFDERGNLHDFEITEHLTGP
jgi:hypothetical protein